MRRGVKSILLSGTIAAVAAVVLCGGSLVYLKYSLTPKQLEGWDAVVALIRSDSELARELDEFKIDTAEHEVVEARGQTGVLMGGPAFYLKCRYNSVDLPDLIAAWGKEEFGTGTWEAPEFGKKYSGVRYDFRQTEGDGAISYAVIDSEEPGVVHYYGYAGDG